LSNKYPYYDLKKWKRMHKYSFLKQCPKCGFKWLSAEGIADYHYWECPNCKLCIDCVGSKYTKYKDLIK